MDRSLLAKSLGVAWACCVLGSWFGCDAGAPFPTSQSKEPGRPRRLTPVETARPIRSQADTEDVSLVQDIAPLPPLPELSTSPQFDSGPVRVSEAGPALFNAPALTPEFAEEDGLMPLAPPRSEASVVRLPVVHDTAPAEPTATAGGNGFDRYGLGPQAESLSVLRLPAVPQEADAQQLPPPAFALEDHGAAQLERASVADAERQALHAVELEAARHIRRGIDLAGRNAYFSARSEFIEALKIVTQALDAREQKNSHSEALAAGLQALEESDDLVPQGSTVPSEMDLELIVAAHRTPIFKGEDAAMLAEVSPLTARQRYYTFAQSQLAAAVDQQRSGSMALYLLGKIETALAERNPSRHKTARYKAIVLHQAALMVDGENFMAANELGVLLAHFGNYQLARNVLLHSLRLSAQPAAWHNLAVVYERLGEPSEAGRARRQATLLARSQSIAGSGLHRPPVVWQSPDAFRRRHARHLPAASRSRRTASTR